MAEYSKNQLAIIVVFYNPLSCHIQQVLRLSNAGQVIIVDNTDSERSDLKENKSVVYCPLYQNKGIAYAQNIGIDIARKLKVSYVLFLDQDSSFEVNEIGILIDEYNKVRSFDTSIAAIGPIVINEATGKEYKSEMGLGETEMVSSIISSGMLTPLEILSEVGGLDNSLFIDNVDHEWCWRASSLGYHVYMTRKVALKHNVGQKTTNLWGFQIIKSSSFRSYYKYRNNILLLRRNYVPFSWKVRTVFHMLFDYVLFFVDYKGYGSDYVKAANRGIKDSIINKNRYEKKTSS